MIAGFVWLRRSFYGYLTYPKFSRFASAICCAPYVQFNLELKTDYSLWIVKARPDTGYYFFFVLKLGHSSYSPSSYYALKKLQNFVLETDLVDALMTF